MWTVFRPLTEWDDDGFAPLMSKRQSGRYFRISKRTLRHNNIHQPISLVQRDKLEPSKPPIGDGNVRRIQSTNTIVSGIVICSHVPPLRSRCYIQNVGHPVGDEDMELHGPGSQPAEDCLRIGPKSVFSVGSSSKRTSSVGSLRFSGGILPRTGRDDVIHFRRRNPP
jgi:hypothetical protein